MQSAMLDTPPSFLRYLAKSRNNREKRRKVLARVAQKCGGGDGHVEWHESFYGDTLAGTATASDDSERIVLTELRPPSRQLEFQSDSEKIFRLQISNQAGEMISIHQARN